MGLEPQRANNSVGVSNWGSDRAGAESNMGRTEPAPLEIQICVLLVNWRQNPIPGAFSLLIFYFGANSIIVFSGAELIV